MTGLQKTIWLYAAAVVLMLLIWLAAFYFSGNFPA